MAIFTNEQITQMTCLLQTNMEAQFSNVILEEVFKDERISSKKDDLIMIFMEHLDNFLSKNKIPTEAITESSVTFLAEKLYEFLISLIEKTTLK
jgi:hypothetical protein